MAKATDARPATNADEAPAAGWYRDPRVPFQLRWWDGDDWTTNVYMPDRNAAPTAAELVPELALQADGKWNFPTGPAHS
jgi:hypothetical protein